MRRRGCIASSTLSTAGLTFTKFFVLVFPAVFESCRANSNELLCSCLCLAARCALEELVRSPAMLEHYKNCRPPIRERYGSMADFVRWKLDLASTPTALKVSLNDFPYSIPPDGQHYVVWSLQPHTNKDLAATSEEWQGVLEKGISGFTGYPEYEGDGFAGQHVQAGRNIRSFIEKHWPSHEGWQTMLYAHCVSCYNLGQPIDRVSAAS